MPPATEAAPSTEALTELVDENHPEVLELVQEAVDEAKGQEVVLPAEVYVEVMEEAIEATEKEMRKHTTEGPL